MAAWEETDIGEMDRIALTNAECLSTIIAYDLSVARHAY
jgi:hypothetical protein